MNRLLLVASAALVCVLLTVSGGVAWSHGGSTYRVEETNQGATITVDKGFPAIGTRARNLALMTLRISGHGKVLTVHDVIATASVVTGHPSGATFAISGTSIGYYCNGTIRSVFTGTLTIKPNGDSTSTVHGRFVGGTGALKGSRSTFISTSARHGTLITTHSTHLVTYPPGVLPQTCQP